METRLNKQAFAPKPETKTHTTPSRDEIIQGWLAAFRTQIVINLIAKLREKEDKDRPDNFAIPFFRYALQKWCTNIEAEMEINDTTKAAALYFQCHSAEFEREFNLVYNPERIQAFLDQQLKEQLLAALGETGYMELDKNIYLVHTNSQEKISEIDEIFWREATIQIKQKEGNFIIDIGCIAGDYLKDITIITKLESKEDKISSTIETSEIKTVIEMPAVLEIDEKKVVIKDMSALTLEKRFIENFRENSYFKNLYTQNVNPTYKDLLYFIKCDYNINIFMIVLEYLLNQSHATSDEKDILSEMIQAFFKVVLPTTTNGEQSLFQLLFTFGSKTDIQRIMLDSGLLPSSVVKHHFNDILAEFEYLYSGFFTEYRDYLGYRVERDASLGVTCPGSTTKQTNAQIFDAYFNGQKTIFDLKQAIDKKNYDEINIALFALSYTGKTGSFASVKFFIDILSGDTFNEKIKVQFAFNIMMGLCYGGHEPAVNDYFKRLARLGLFGSACDLTTPKDEKQVRLRAFYRCMFIASIAGQHIESLFEWNTAHQRNFKKIDPSFPRIIKNKAVLLSKSSEIAGSLFIYNVKKFTDKIRFALLDNLRCRFALTSHTRIINKLCLNIEANKEDAIMLDLHDSIAEDFLPVIKFLLENNRFPVVLIEMVLSYFTSYFTYVDIAAIIKNKLQPVVIPSIEVVEEKQQVKSTTVSSATSVAVKGQNVMAPVEVKQAQVVTTPLAVTISQDTLFSPQTMSQSSKNPKINMTTFLIELLKFVGAQLAAFFLVFAPGTVYYADNQYKPKK